MRLVSWDWFYYIIVGFILGGGCAYLHAYLKVKATKLNWLELSLSILFGITFVLMWQTIIGSFYEGEPRVAWFTLIFIGLLLVAMGLGIFRSFRSRHAPSKSG